MKSKKQKPHDVLKYMAMSAWLGGYASGLPESLQKEKDRINEAAHMLLEIFQNQYDPENNHGLDHD